MKSIKYILQEKQMSSKKVVHDNVRLTFDSLFETFPFEWKNINMFRGSGSTMPFGFTNLFSIAAVIRKTTLLKKAILA